MGGRFTGDVPGVELRDGCIDVVEIEQDDRRNQLVCVDFDDDQHLGKEGFDPFVITR